MITKKIEILGKEVTLAYCYATEIAYKDLSGEELPLFIASAVNNLANNRMPDIKQALFAIIASMMPVYQTADEEPIKDTDLMNDADPREIGTAIGTLINLYAEFYHIPKDEPEDKPATGGSPAKKSKKRKNA